MSSYTFVSNTPNQKTLFEKDKVRDHLANERTFLAWVRTSIGVMTFGFVVVKFSLFVRQLSLILGKETLINTHGYSSFAGIVLVVIGVLVLLFAYVQYKKTEKNITEENYRPSSKLNFILTIVILVIGILLIIFLFDNLPAEAIPGNTPSTRTSL